MAARGGSSFTGGGSVAYSGCKVYNSGTQTPTVTTWTPVTFDSEEWDTASYHSTSSNTSRIVAPSTGKYRFYFSTNAAALSTQWACAFRVNGTGTSASPATSPNLSRPIQHGSPNSGSTQVWCYAELALTAGDWVEAMVYLYNSTAIGNSDGTNYPEDQTTLICEFMG